MTNILNGFIAAATGVLSGWGIGGGSLLMVYMTAFAGMARLTAVCVNLLYFIPTAGSSMVGHTRNKQIVWRVFLPAAGAGLATAALAALWSNQLDGPWLKRGFGVLLLVIGLRELFRKNQKDTAE